MLNNHKAFQHSACFLSATKTMPNEEWLIAGKSTNRYI